MPDIVKPGNEQLYDKSGRPSAKQFLWLQLVTDLDLISGSGAPEGVIEARQKRFYMDEIGGAGNVMYVKVKNQILGDRTKGWVLI